MVWLDSQKLDDKSEESSFITPAYISSWLQIIKSIMLTFSFKRFFSIYLLGVEWAQGTTTCVWRWEENLQELVFSFHHRGLGMYLKLLRLNVL